jgi:hypothetical protein
LSGTDPSESIHRYCGVIAIGPFGYMLNRISEAILSAEMGSGLPFLVIESDRNLFPQIITMTLEVFLLQTMKIHKQMAACR